jgi:tRNA C32,U32 (ribose-2'-O)-methylase TrmJ
MPEPVTVVAGLNAAVAVAKIGYSVWDRIFTRRQELPDRGTAAAAQPTSEELAKAFIALDGRLEEIRAENEAKLDSLQSGFDRRYRRLTGLLLTVLVAQAATVAVLALN